MSFGKITFITTISGAGYNTCQFLRYERVREEYHNNKIKATLAGALGGLVWPISIGMHSGVMMGSYLNDYINKYNEQNKD